MPSHVPGAVISDVAGIGSGNRWERQTMRGRRSAGGGERRRGVRGFDLPGPRLLPAALVPFLRVIVLPLLVSALGLDAIFYVVSKWLEWPCWSSLCLLLG